MTAVFQNIIHFDIKLKRQAFSIFGSRFEPMINKYSAMLFSKLSSINRETLPHTLKFVNGLKLKAVRCS
ncbi:hypothetical protein DSUL_60200 [Desulfovibrionales bacterium]